MKRLLSILLLAVMCSSLLLGAFPVSAASATAAPKAPISLSYRLDKVGGGRAAGVVSVTLPAGHNADDIYLFWGNAIGKLEGYTALAPFKVAGTVATHRIAEGTVIPFGATKLLAYSYSDIGGFSNTFASFDLPEGAALSDSDLGDLEFEFQSVSDIHIATQETNSSRVHHLEHYKAMLNDIVKISPNSIGIFNNGDSVDKGQDVEYALFLSTWASIVGAPNIYSGFGNHETFRFGTDSNFKSDDASFAEEKSAYQQICQNIPQDANFSGGDRFSSLSFSFDMEGSRFIFLGTDVVHQNILTLNESTLDWVENQLATAHQAGKKIFVLMHQPMPNTVTTTYKGTSKYNESYYGGASVENTTANALKAMFKKYPEMILFDGHNHSDLNSANIYVAANGVLPHIFGTSSVGYLGSVYNTLNNTTYVGSEGYYVYVYEDKVLVRGRDFLNGEWIASAQFIVDLSAGASTKKTVAAPLYGSKVTLHELGGKVGGTIKAFIPSNHNATAFAAFFADADTGILGTDPFTTGKITVSNTDSQGVTMSFLDVPLPANADYIVVYSYSETYGWSVDYDVIDLSQYVMGGGAPASGVFSMNKYEFTVGEEIIVTVNQKSNTNAWMGFRNLASTSASTLNYWYIEHDASKCTVDTHKNSNGTTKITASATVGQPIKLTEDNAVFQRDFTALTPGVYEIGWLEVEGGGFAAGKKAEHLTTFIIRAEENISTSGNVKTDKKVYLAGETILVTALRENTSGDWIGVHTSSSTATDAKLWYKISMCGVNTPLNIAEKTSFTGTSGTTYAFNTLSAGEYTLAWIAASETSYKNGKKKAENILTFVVVAQGSAEKYGLPSANATPNTDNTTLNDLLSQASKKDRYDYTADSWSAFVTARNAATNTKNSGTATQTQINTAAKNLQTAMAALIQKANTTTLVAKITEAEAFVEANYTSESWIALQTALATAKNAKNSGIPEEVQQAEIELAVAIAKMSPISATTPDANNTAPGATTQNTGGFSPVIVAIIAAGCVLLTACITAPIAVAIGKRKA